MKKLRGIKKWEVKTGKSRGYYVAATRKDAQKFFPEWGMLNDESWSTECIRRRHGVPAFVGKEPVVILTHSIEARGVMRKHWERVEITK